MNARLLAIANARSATIVLAQNVARTRLAAKYPSSSIVVTTHPCYPEPDARRSDSRRQPGERIGGGFVASPRLVAGHRGAHPFAFDLVPDQRRQRRLLDRRDVGTARCAALGEKPLDDPELFRAAGALTPGRSSNAPHPRFIEVDKPAPDRRVAWRDMRRQHSMVAWCLGRFRLPL